ncbi:hypothetical protein BH09BAC1_BH09BAC1_25820 [soil metagenome]
MKQIILVAGATGNLGERIVKALKALGAEVRVLARPTSNTKTLQRLSQLGATIHTLNEWTVAEIAQACQGVDCVVSVLAGLRDVIIDAQTILLDGAIAAGVPRFIPSDFSTDFTKFNRGENRNLDLRGEFHEYLDKKNIKSTSVFNGAFLDMITGQMPLILFKQKMVLYWGDADHSMVFTAMDDTAVYTAHVALDTTAPRYLRIAGEVISPRALREVVSEVSGERYKLLRTGGPTLLSLIIKIASKLAPSPGELYPAWQGMQYMRNMIDKRSDLARTDNMRYPGLHWTTAKDVLTVFAKSK